MNSAHDGRFPSTYRDRAIRRAILARLAQGDASVAEHAGQRRPRRIEARPLAEASGWLDRYRKLWESNFARLDTLLDELQRQPSTATKKTAKGRKRTSRRS